MSLTQPSRPEFSVGLGAGLLLGIGAALLLAGVLPLPAGLNQPSQLLNQGLDGLTALATALLPWLRHAFLLALGVAALLLLATMFVRPAPADSAREAAAPTSQTHSQMHTRFGRASAAFASQQAPAPEPHPLPSPLLRHAEELLKQAHTVPNFSTTPFSGQQRVLSKLAQNFVPEPQRTAAVSLALFRLRRPAAFA